MVAEIGGGTMLDMPAPKKNPDRSPSWKLFVRIDPDLEAQVEAYCKSFEYEPTLSKVVERALRLLLADHKRASGRGGSR